MSKLNRISILEKYANVNCFVKFDTIMPEIIKITQLMIL